MPTLSLWGEPHSMAFSTPPFMSYALSSWNYLMLGHVTRFPVAMGQPYSGSILVFLELHDRRDPQQWAWVDPACRTTNKNSTGFSVRKANTPWGQASLVQVNPLSIKAIPPEEKSPPRGAWCYSPAWTFFVRPLTPHRLRAAEDTPVLWL
jgi:hypothetical protein